MTHQIEIFIRMTDDQKAEFKSISDREKALADERADFVRRACMDHPDVKVAARLAHFTGKPRAEIVGDGKFKVVFAFPTAETPRNGPPAVTTPLVAPEYVDPKTMNSLLASKLLTDDEKRRMLAAVFPRTMELVKEPDAAAPNLLEALEELVAVARRAVRLSKEHDDFRLHSMEPMLLAMAAAIAAIARAKGETT
jgi:hypothetical protein